jgi:ATP-dependent RNA helicase RhlE
MTTFQSLNLSTPLLQALKSKGYTVPSPIQEKAIPFVLEGKDIFGSARTGTGKTAAFALPILQLLSNKQKTSRHARALILAPTRELAQQINDSFTDYGKNTRLKHTVIYGGVSQKNQVDSLRRGVDIIIATPGRLLDLMQQKHLSLHAIEYLVLDEGDRMLDMGFINDINRICAEVPAERQSMLFSATLSKEIKKLAANILKQPVNIDIEPDKTIDTFTKEQVYFIDKASKASLLQHLVAEERIDRSLVFTRTRRGADKLVKALARIGIMAQAIHGDKSQAQRQRALNQFKSRKLSMLIATDVASRGIDINDLSHVINYDIPEQTETYTHRIGRTGRAGLDGIAYSFCSPDEKSYLKDIQRFTGKNIPVVEHPYSSSFDESAFSKAVENGRQKRNGNKKASWGNANDQKSKSRRPRREFSRQNG